MFEKENLKMPQEILDSGNFPEICPNEFWWLLPARLLSPMLAEYPRESVLSIFLVQCLILSFSLTRLEAAAGEIAQNFSPAAKWTF